MNFASDNTAPVHPKVLEALVKANDGYATPYGEDALTRQAADKVREVLDAPDAAVHFVSLGTAANALLLATMTPPWSTAFCSDVAHIHEDECNAPEFYMGGGKLSLVPSAGGMISAEALNARIAQEETRGLHGPQRGPISITQVTEKGSVYGLDALAALTGVGKAHGLAAHMDGARFANALVSLGCSPAEMSWQAGFDALSFGGTKNGLMAVEAAVLFDPEQAYELELRRKRGGHLFSKHRYLAAQMLAYLEDGLWLEMAAQANAMGEALRDGLLARGGTLAAPCDANLMFMRLPRAAHRKALGGGAQYYLMEDADLDAGDPATPLLARFVASWSTTQADLGAFFRLLGD